MSLHSQLAQTELSMKWLFSLEAVAKWIWIEIHFMHVSPIISLGPELAEIFRWLSNGIRYVLIMFMFCFFTKESEKFVADLLTQAKQPK